MTNRSQSTGPVTKEGKAISSKNATKGGIFAKGYLPNEDGHEQEILVYGLVKAWQADQYPERITLIRDIEEADLRRSRVMMCERLQIEAAMQSLNVAQEFGQIAGFSPSAYLSFPHWFFRDDEVGVTQKDWASHVDRAQEEALELKRTYCDQLVPHIAQKFSALYDYVMERQPAGTSFITVLGAHYKQSAPTLNLGVVSNQITEKYPNHLIWARDPQRYEIFISGIRARLTTQILMDERTNRYLIGAQNRKIKAEHTLAALEQLSWQRQDRQRNLGSTISAAGPDPAKKMLTTVLGEKGAKTSPVTLGAGEVSVTLVDGKGNANGASFTVSS
jgi:hypothetical protein